MARLPLKFSQRQARFGKTPRMSPGQLGDPIREHQTEMAGLKAIGKTIQDIEARHEAENRQEVETNLNNYRVDLAYAREDVTKISGLDAEEWQRQFDEREAKIRETHMAGLESSGQRALYDEQAGNFKRSSDVWLQPRIIAGIKTGQMERDFESIQRFGPMIAQSPDNYWEMKGYPRMSLFNSFGRDQVAFKENAQAMDVYLADNYFQGRTNQGFNGANILAQELEDGKFDSLPGAMRDGAWKDIATVRRSHLASESARVEDLARRTTDLLNKGEGGLLQRKEGQPSDLEIEIVTTVQDPKKRESLLLELQAASSTQGLVELTNEAPAAVNDVLEAQMAQVMEDVRQSSDVKTRELALEREKNVSAALDRTTKERESDFGKWQRKSFPDYAKSADTAVNGFNAYQQAKVSGAGDEQMAGIAMETQKAMGKVINMTRDNRPVYLGNNSYTDNLSEDDRNSLLENFHKDRGASGQLAAMDTLVRVYGGHTGAVAKELFGKEKEYSTLLVAAGHGLSQASNDLVSFSHNSKGNKAAWNDASDQAQQDQWDAQVAEALMPFRQTKTPYDTVGSDDLRDAVTKYAHGLYNERAVPQGEAINQAIKTFVTDDYQFSGSMRWHKSELGIDKENMDRVMGLSESFQGWSQGISHAVLPNRNVAAVNIGREFSEAIGKEAMPDTYKLPGKQWTVHPAPDGEHVFFRIKGGPLDPIPNKAGQPLMIKKSDLSNAGRPYQQGGPGGFGDRDQRGNPLPTASDVRDDFKRSIRNAWEEGSMSAEVEAAMLEEIKAWRESARKEFGK